MGNLFNRKYLQKGFKKMTFGVKRTAFLFALTLVFFLIPKAASAENVGVDLVWKFPEPGWLEIEIRQGVYNLELNQNRLSLKSGDNIKIGQSALALFVYQAEKLTVLEKPQLNLTSQGNGVFRVREPGKDWVSYRGDLLVSRAGPAWKLLNTLDREDYLKGVVPIEMSNAWAAKGYEALKAQAVAARTYLLKNMDAKGRITDSPDIHQAYWGRTVEGEASKAVEATKGEILVDAATNQPISIFYSSHNGGYSELTQNVWENHDPHYATLPDPFSANIGGNVNEWHFYVAADVLGKSFGLAPVREVNVREYVSGRVFEVKITDWLGAEKTISGGDLVRKFYPYGREITKDSFLGRLFEVGYIFPKTGKDDTLLANLPAVSRSWSADPGQGPLLSRFQSSNQGPSELPRDFGVFVFNGRGWGHGVGMSQWGAYNMAMNAYSYEDILYYYYKNTKLVKAS